MDGFLEPTCEGDRERVERWFPPDDPACSATAGRVKRPGHEIQTLQRRGLIWEMAPGSDSPPVAGVDRLDSVRRADHLSESPRRTRGTAQTEAHADSQSFTIAGYLLPHSAANSSNRSFAAASDGAV